VLSEGHYRKHIDRIRNKLDGVREKVIKRLEQIGIAPVYHPAAGIFLWVDTGRDTSAMTERAWQQGLLLAPGSLFSPNQLPSNKMRINIAAMSGPDIWAFLQREMG
jgi:DNA-binding transcriptional MocR family regulator